MKLIIKLILFILCYGGFCVRAQSVGTNFSQKLSAAGNDADRTVVYVNEITHFISENPDSASYFCNEGLNYFRRSNYKEGEAQMLSLLAKIELAKNKLDVAKQLFKEAAEASGEAGDTIAVAIMNNSIGMIDGMKGNYQIASVRFQDDIRVFKSAKDTPRLADTYLKLGVVYEHFNKLDSALYYYFMAMDLNQKKSFHQQEVTLLNNIGIVYGKKSVFDSARNYFSLALSKCTDSSYNMLKASILLDFGLLYREMYKTDSSRFYLNQSIELSLKNNLGEQYVLSLKAKASTYEGTNNDSAKIYLEQALAAARGFGRSKLEVEIYDDLVEVYKSEKNYLSALECTEKKQLILDSLLTKERSEEMANLRTLGEMERKRVKTEQFNFLVNKNYTKRKLILIAVICNVVALVILAYSYRKSIILNKQLVKRTVELSESNEVKDKLFSIIGHDLRGPIGNIPVLLELYEDEELTSDDRKFFFDSVKELAVSCNETLDKMLYWGKSKIKGDKDYQQIFLAKEPITNCIRLVKSAASRKKINIIDTTADDLKVFADPEQFSFVVRNLISNAIKFTFEKGNIVLSADLKREPGFVTFSVKDDGMGIEIDKIPNIFNAINKGTIGTKQEKGTNIGLKLCKDFVIENGGQIWVESELNKGTTFFFTMKSA